MSSLETIRELKWLINELDSHWLGQNDHANEAIAIGILELIGTYNDQVNGPVTEPG